VSTANSVLVSQAIRTLAALRDEAWHSQDALDAAAGGAGSGPHGGAPRPATAQWPAGRGSGSEAPTPRAFDGALGAPPRATQVGTPGGGGGSAAAAKGLMAVAAALPEALGLPLDDTQAFLQLLRRHILYGPTLGLAAAAPVAAGGGGGGGGGAPGPAPAGSAAGSFRPRPSTFGAALAPSPSASLLSTRPA
jgi:hypothetical protein